MQENRARSLPGGIKREYDEVENLPEKEKAEIEEILADYGISNRVKKNLLTNFHSIKINGWNS